MLSVIHWEGVRTEVAKEGLGKWICWDTDMG